MNSSKYVLVEVTPKYHVRHEERIMTFTLQVFSRFELSKANNDDHLQSLSSHHEETSSKLFETTKPENRDMSNEDGSCQTMDILLNKIPNNLETISAAIQNHGSNSEERSSLSSVTSLTSSKHPTLTMLLGMDAVARVTMLRKHINMAETRSSLSMDECLWLFALCAAVDIPLDAETSAALRSLLRKCADLRAQKSELDEEVVMLNILAVISGRYFGQSEN